MPCEILDAINPFADIRPTEKKTSGDSRYLKQTYLLLSLVELLAWALIEQKKDENFF